MLLRKLRSFTRLPILTILWLPAVWLLLGLSRAAILLVSFKRLSRFLGQSTDRFDFVPAITEQQADRVIQIRKLVRVAARNTPWVSNCFPQAIVVRLLMGIYRIPYALYFGLRRDVETGDLMAHAWVMSGEYGVCGVLGDETYQPVGCYGCQTWEGR
jgi:hypothetical protein